MAQMVYDYIKYFPKHFPAEEEEIELEFNGICD